MQISLPSFFAKRAQLKSTFCEVVKVHAETPKSFDVTLSPLFRQASACWRCGRSIENPKSILWGVGPDCASALGLPWEDPPEARGEVTKDNAIRVFLPKSLLMDSEILALASLVDAPTYKEAPTLNARVWLEDNRLWVSSPYVNKIFIDELRKLADRKWDAKKKLNHFSPSTQTLEAIVNLLKQWDIAVEIDESVNTFASDLRKRKKATQAQMKELGVESVDEIKYAPINVDEMEWGLKTKPWLHQAQAITYAVTMLGGSIKRKQ